MLFRIGIALFVIFLTLVLAAILPIKLIEPTWQLRLVGSLVNNAFIALIGLVLINLAPEFSTSERLNRRRLRIANLAVIASIGYLLIVPLQGLAVWQGLSTFNQVQTRQLQGAKEKIELIRKALKESTSTADLQTRLQAIPGPSLPPLDTNRPLAEVRPQLLSILDSAQSQVRQRSVGLSGDRLQRLTQESVRIGVSALVFACAFASGSVWPGSSRNLFDSWIQGFSKVARLLFGGLRPGTRGGGRGRKTANQEYFEQISGSNQDPNR
ncbi:MAG: HpsJ family protein [Synechococcaceae cyanobacterium]